MATGDGQLTDAEVLGRLAPVDDPAWDELWAATDELIRRDAWVTWTPSRTGEDGVITLGYPEYCDEWHRVHRALGGVGAVVPFAWPDWPDLPRYRDGADLSPAPAADAVRVITAVVRGERFGDGNIAGALASGVLQSALARLRRWHAEGA
jgi:hypothetical protein